MTERRKAETRREIARTAARLFVSRGLRATRAEDIAQAAGIAPRTFYRYFATKEEAVAPLYAEGGRRWADAVRDAPADLSLPAALEHATRYILTPDTGISVASWEWVRTLVRLAHTSPGLRRVWAEVCQAAEWMLAENLAARLGGPGAGARVPGREGAGDGASLTPEIRFAAAVASAAVRVAVEAWAAGSAAASGEEGPASLALRNLSALRGFPWESGTT
ncbi:TetR/AcrR family transcriptional regulator [Streptomyces sp. NPDC006012]|uniref:TetR/AcrR family transcriptional regulator n=1 Tax=Streptomyces sp. NPDC006012 TaxID=3364739 RepID=UPI0036C99C6B